MSYNYNRHKNNQNGKGCSQAFGCLSIVIISALFALILGLTLPFYAATQVLLTPDTYKEALEQNDFSNRYAGLFVEQMVYSDPEKLSMEGMPCINVQEFSAKDWSLIATQLTPPPWIKTQTNSLIDQIFALPDGDGTDPALWISTLEFRDLMAGEGGFAFYQGLVEDKHACTFSDIFEITAWALNPIGSCLAICQPINQLNIIIGSILPTLASNIPETYNLTPFIGAEALVEMRKYLILGETARSAALILALLSFGLLPLTLLSRRARSCSGWLISWGAPLALAGLTVTVAAVLIPVFSKSWAPGLLASAGLAPGTVVFVMDMLGEIVKSIAIYTGLPGLALGVGGLVMLSVSAIAAAAQSRNGRG